MAASDTVWGIDIGACALKALKLRLIEGELRVEAFDVIEHPQILSQAEGDRDQLVLNALEQFLARNNVGGSKVVVAAPGQGGFTRFVKLPPVETKRVPEIVRFEAEQQIPFDINEVIWRWQAFQDPDSPDIEVGIFAMKRADVGDALERYTDVGINVDVVQMAPLALYNFMDFDGQIAPEGATLLIDVGADKTDLVVADGPRIWTRTLQLGGNNFTSALVKAFKLSFGKAEKLKRSAATHKYARQIFQAMRPVFAELVQEIQRSIGYYTSLHRDSRFQRVVGLGNGFRLPGLQKFLEQNLGLPVVRVDTFNHLPPSTNVNAPAFTENVLGFGVAYGLALQGLEQTKIQTNLLPSEIARQRRWSRKKPWFAAAAAVLLVAMVGIVYRSYADRIVTAPDRSKVLAKVREEVKASEGLRGQWEAVRGRDKTQEEEILQYHKMLLHRDVWPTMQHLIAQAINRNATNQGLLSEGRLKELQAIPRPVRSVVMVESIVAEYRDDVSTVDVAELRRSKGIVGGPGARGFMPGAAAPIGTPAPAAGGAEVAAATGPQKGYLLYVSGSTPLQGGAVLNLLDGIRNALQEMSKRFPSVEVRLPDVVERQAGMIGMTPGMGGFGAPGAQQLDPLTGEEAVLDTRFTLGWVVVIKEPSPAGAAPEKTGAE